MLGPTRNEMTRSLTPQFVVRVVWLNCFAAVSPKETSQELDTQQCSARCSLSAAVNPTPTRNSQCSPIHQSFPFAPGAVAFFVVYFYRDSAVLTRSVELIATSRNAKETSAARFFRRL